MWYVTRGHGNEKRHAKTWKLQVRTRYPTAAEIYERVCIQSRRLIQTAVKYIFLPFLPLDYYQALYLKKYFLVQAEKHLTRDFVRCISLWP